LGKFSKSGIMATLAILVLGLSVSPANAIVIGKPVELYYDDDGFEEGWGAVSGCMFAVHFVYNPPIPIRIFKGQITEAKVFISSEPAEFKLHILDRNKMMIFSKMVTPTGTGWCAIDLSKNRVKIVGDFYVAVEYLHRYVPYIGYDTTSPDGEGWFLSSTQEWMPISQAIGYDGDLGIRVTVSLAV